MAKGCREFFKRAQHKTKQSKTKQNWPSHCKRGRARLHFAIVATFVAFQRSRSVEAIISLRYFHGWIEVIHARAAATAEHSFAKTRINKPDRRQCNLVNLCHRCSGAASFPAFNREED